MTREPKVWRIRSGLIHFLNVAQSVSPVYTMRKLLMALAFLACAPLRGQSPPVGIKSGSNQKHQAEFSPPKTEPDHRGTKESPLIVDTKGHVNTKEEAAEDKKNDDRKALIDGWTVGSAVAVAIFTGVLMIIGWRGVQAANNTLTAIHRQIDLQERAMRQWVNTDNWRSEIRPMEDPAVEFRHCVRVRFDLINPTQAPLTIPAGVIVFNLPKRPASEVTLRRDYMLVPGRPYETEAMIYMNDHELREYSEAKFPLLVDGDISHIGSLGLRQTQYLYGTLWRNSGGASYYERTKPADPQDREKTHP